MVEVLHLILVKVLQLGDISRRGVLGGGKAKLLAFHLLTDGGDFFSGLGLCLGNDGVHLLLGLRHHLVGHPLGGKHGFAHGFLGGAVFLDLIRQHLHLGLQRGVFFV